MLRALQELRLETGIGKEVKAWFEEMLTYELEKLEFNAYKEVIVYIL